LKAKAKRFSSNPSSDRPRREIAGLHPTACFRRSLELASSVALKNDSVDRAILIAAT
jgi:hypothetical protein